MLARLAARGLGVAIRPASAVSAYASTLRAIPIGEPPLRGRLALVWRAEGPINPAARVLLNQMRDGLADL